MNRIKNALLSVVNYFLVINILVFVSWKMGGTWGFDLEFMAKNFLVSWSSLAGGRPWTLITSVFSHNMFFHLFMNMYVLSSFGPVIQQVLGRWRFFLFYMIAGVVSSFSHAFVSAWLLHEPNLPALGASGAISGIIMLFCLLFPKEKIVILVFPIRAIWGAVLFVSLDFWGLSAQAGGGGLPIGHGAHLGGALCGALYYGFLVLRRRSRIRNVRRNTR
jgi:membrane associated rhomboid family serine protease